MPVPNYKWQDWLMDWESRRQTELSDLRGLIGKLAAEQNATRALLLEMNRASTSTKCMGLEGTPDSPPVPTTSMQSIANFDSAQLSKPGLSENDENKEEAAEKALANGLVDLSAQLRLAIGWKDEMTEQLSGGLKYITGDKNPGVIRKAAIAVVDSPWFIFAAGSTIILNFISIGVQMHFDMERAFEKKDPLDWQQTLNFMFAIVFAIELLLRLLAEGYYFFCGPSQIWNMFDSFVVVSAIAEIIFESFSLSFLRVLRVFRVIRMLRIIRVFRFFRELRLMAVSLASCITSLMWAFLLLLMCMLLFGMILLDGASEYVRDHNPNDLAYQGFEENYNGVPRMVFSLLLAVSGGKDWFDLVEPFMSISWMYAVMFTCFVLFVMFGMLNILIGIFVQKSEELFHLDQELVMQEAMSRQSSYLNQIQKLFKEVDTDQSNSLTWDELNTNLQNEKVMTYFSLLHIDVTEAKGLFQLLDVNESGSVGIDEFIMGCMRLKGAAKSIDMATMLYENKRLAMKLNRFFSATEEKLLDIKYAIKGGGPPERVSHWDTSPKTVKSRSKSLTVG